MADEPLLIERTAAVATLTLNDPPQNPIGQRMVEMLTAAIGEFGADPDVGAIVLRGAGERAFSAGANLKELSTSLGKGGLKTNLAQRHAMAEAIESCPKPVVAAIHGTCMGGGLEIALACHFRLASELAVFALPEINLGVIPAWGGTQRLPRVVGREAALELMLRASRWSAARALELGLVSRVYPRELLVPKATAFAESLTGKPPLAVAAILESVRTGLRDGFSAGIEAEIKGIEATTASKDNIEGVTAFLQKRKPRFGGK